MPLFVRPESGVAASVQARTALPPGEALRAIAALPLPAVFLRWGPFPGVVAVDLQTGAWDVPGRSRRPRFTDGGTAVETLVEYTPPSSFAYELRGFTDVFGRVVEGVRGEWTFAPDGDGSVVRWTWEFKPKAGCRTVLAAVVVPLYRRYMQRVVDRSVELVDPVRTAAAGRPLLPTRPGNSRSRHSTLPGCRGNLQRLPPGEGDHGRSDREHLG